MTANSVISSAQDLAMIRMVQVIVSPDLIDDDLFIQPPRW